MAVSKNLVVVYDAIDWDEGGDLVYWETKNGGYWGDFVLESTHDAHRLVDVD